MPKRTTVDDLLERMRTLLSEATDEAVATKRKTLQRIATDAGVDTNTLRGYRSGGWIRSIPLDVGIRWAQAVGITPGDWQRVAGSPADPVNELASQIETRLAELIRTEIRKALDLRTPSPPQAVGRPARLMPSRRRSSSARKSRSGTRR